MKRGFLFLLLFLTFTGGFLFNGCAGPFVRNDLETTYKPKIQKVAILPFKNITTNKEAVQAHIGLREGIFAELKREDVKYTCVIQEIAETDQKLIDAGITPENLSSKTSSELGQILEVDAVMQGTLIKYHEKGKAGQWATLILFGGATGAEVICRVKITDCNSTNLLWDWELNEKGGFLTSPESVANKIGRKIAKKWPLKRK